MKKNKNLVEKIQKKHDVKRDNLKYLETARIIIYLQFTNSSFKTFKMSGWTFVVSPWCRSGFFLKTAQIPFCCALLGH